MNVTQNINKAKMTYMDATKTDTRMYRSVIMAAIENGGKFNEDFADIFVLTKTPEGSAVDYVLNFI